MEGKASPRQLRRLRNTIAFAALAVTLRAENQTADLTQATLDDLMNVRVTSVSKKAESLSGTGSAIYVISRDDIRRSGATNVPDLLRMVPGVNVARVNANTWAISIRGFNFRYSSKVLVLIDGRTVYTPGFSGVYWDQQMMPLEDIDRIEVIRGPGGTVWGANAMNGVINIITRSADETRGGLASAVAGSQDRAQGLLQYGGNAGARGAYRVYGRYAMNENSPSIPGSPAQDGYKVADDAAHNIQGGFRADWALSAADKLTVQGDLLGTSEHQTITTLFDSHLPDLYTFTDPVQVSSGNLLGRWTHAFANGSEATLQMYYDRFRRYDQALNVETTGDFDFQYHFRAGARQDIVAGVGYRVADQNYTDGYEITFGSGHRRDHLFNTFVQDEIKLSSSLSLTLGTKLEHNGYTGIEYEPSTRLVWLAGAHQTLWVSASRAIQQPSWLDAESQLDIQTVPVPGVGFGVIHLGGNPALPAPVMFDYELGYRTEISKQLTLDTSLFFSDYHRLSTIEPEAPYFAPAPAPAHLVIPSIYEGFGKAQDYGIEFSARWNVAKWWRLSPGFSLLRMNVSQDPRSQDTSFPSTPGDSPKHQAQLRSNVSLPHHVDWDVSAFHVGALAGASTAAGQVPAYTRLDSRVAWRAGESTEFSITGQNLLTPRHLEFLDGLQVTPSQAARAIVARVTWAF